MVKSNNKSKGKTRRKSLPRTAKKNTTLIPRNNSDNVLPHLRDPPSSNKFDYKKALLKNDKDTSIGPEFLIRIDAANIDPDVNTDLNHLLTMINTDNSRMEKDDVTKDDLIAFINSSKIPKASTLSEKRLPIRLKPPSTMP